MMCAFGRIGWNVRLGFIDQSVTNGIQHGLIVAHGVYNIFGGLGPAKRQCLYFARCIQIDGVDAV